MMDLEDAEEEASLLCFDQQRQFANWDGWLQGRYYGEEGQSVRTMLSFNAVFEIHPYEVGVDRRAERRAYKEHLQKITRLMELADLLPRPFNTLSNGEMRRVLFARAVLTNPKRLILDDPMAGLDPRQRERFRRIIRALAQDGMDIRVRCRYADEFKAHRDLKALKGPKDLKASKALKVAKGAKAPKIVELNGITVKYGRRKLFDNFSWTIRQGERWVLRGPNGSGKTTLMALITGDSPLAYANDVKVFGQPREPGHELRTIRRRIAMVSPEMQTYLDKGPEELLEEALAREPDLLILDEPCLNLDAKDAHRLCRRVAAWLKARPTVTAICIAHREDHVPNGFDQVVDLGSRMGGGGECSH